MRELVTALREHNMGLIIDIVPNHMGVGTDENAWWNDVLRNGPKSEFAHFFDIDWSKPLLLPILGSTLEQALANGDIVLTSEDGPACIRLYDERTLPLRPDEEQTGNEDIAAQLDRQHYRLGWWRTANDELNWRRFFTISELAGLRIEDESVFEATHALYFRLYAEGLIDGVRVDHVDGLTDPACYCRTLRARLDAIERPAGAPPGPAYIVVEKILGPGEELARGWEIDGTSGYDFMEEVSALLHDPAGQEPLDALWEKVSGRPADFHAEELRARQDMLAWSFEGQLQSCIGAFYLLAQSAQEASGFTEGMFRRAIVRLLWNFPVYRTYGTGGDAPAADRKMRDIARAGAARFTPPGEIAVTEAILSWLAGEGPGEKSLTADAVRRFQQLSAPIAAKAVEDTAFYRYGRLISRTDVGFAPASFSRSIEQFHVACRERMEAFPGGMLATATHDHKRGEDVRARLAVLSSIPDLWRKQVARWEEMTALDCDVHSADRYILWQTMFGAWPDGLAPDDGSGLANYAARIRAWQEKALREAKLRSSWEQPDERYEAACAAWIDKLLDPARSADFLTCIHGFVTGTSAATLANSLAQHYLVPGMPDLYQGTELADFSLEDPDNRRPVDFARRKELLGSSPPGDPKLGLIQNLLSLRRRHPALFARGGYEAVAVHGARADHIIAFRRVGEDGRICGAVMLRCGDILLECKNPVPPANWWEDTEAIFGSGQGDRITAAEMFEQSPIFVRQD